jgi:hypothetical protein
MPGIQLRRAQDAANASASSMFMPDRPDYTKGTPKNTAAHQENSKVLSMFSR